jgi:hypothetical protein
VRTVPTRTPQLFGEFHGELPLRRVLAIALGCRIHFLHSEVRTRVRRLMLERRQSHTGCDVASGLCIRSKSPHKPLAMSQPVCDNAQLVAADRLVAAHDSGMMVARCFNIHRCRELFVCRRLNRIGFRQLACSK